MPSRKLHGASTRTHTSMRKNVSMRTCEVWGTHNHKLTFYYNMLNYVMLKIHSLTLCEGTFIFVQASRESFINIIKCF